MRLQGLRPQPLHMESREQLDRALVTAVEHTEQKQRELVDEPPGSPRAGTLATEVVHGAEDLDVLAADAREATEEEISRPRPTDSDPS
jgi:hypothetical protein